MKLINEIGNRYDRLLVLSRANNHGGFAQWLCRCDCGKEVVIIGTSLRSKNTRSCGCLLKESASRNGKLRFDDLTNQKFGKLTCVKRIDYSGKDPLWLCQCECGGLTNVFANNLKRGTTQSCGCLKSIGEEKISKILKENKIPFFKRILF